MADKNWGYMYGLIPGNELISGRHASPFIERNNKMKACLKFTFKRLYQLMRLPSREQQNKANSLARIHYNILLNYICCIFQADINRMLSWMMDSGINQKILIDTFRAGKIPPAQRIKSLQPLSVVRYLKSNDNILGDLCKDYKRIIPG